MDENVRLEGDLIGKRVEWEKSGRGRGEFAEGRVLALVEAGTTNETAIEIVSDEYDEYIFRPSYNQFDDATRTTNRAIVAVKQETERARDIFYFYAPNRLELRPA